MADIRTRIEHIDRRLEELPRGTLTYKTINGRKQPYLQRTVNGKSISVYLRQGEREQILLELEERNALAAEKERLLVYASGLTQILRQNAYLDRRMSVGYQNFGELMESGFFYVDKTHFISEWWERGDQVSLITRPRRFGKTLMLSTLDYFFSPDHAGHESYFKSLRIWKMKKYHDMYGRIPTIFLSFSGVKGRNFASAMGSIALELYECLHHYRYLESEQLDSLRDLLFACSMNPGNYEEYSFAVNTIRILAEKLEHYYGVKPIILLDEYDTPLTESYVTGYWDEMICFYRSLISESFKQNSHYQKAVITGVTRVSKNALFSDMNHICVYSCTDPVFADCFGFTEQEVQDALLCHDIHEMEAVKQAYDGFVFGGRADIYNPWSICNYMRDRTIRPYWINTASNDLIGELICKNPVRVKEELEELLAGKTLRKKINEEIAFQYLNGEEEAFWSLLLATGYIKAMNVQKTLRGTECDIAITNQETLQMFQNQILRMFHTSGDTYNQFVRALLKADTDTMQMYLEDLAFASLSYFDTGKQPARRIPENFYHGLVLGLLVALQDTYVLQSNRESGAGRYDLALIPKTSEGGQNAYLIEFKVLDRKKEKTLPETAQRALQQIRDKEYGRALLQRGISREKIHLFGIGFEGKHVEIADGSL